MSKSKLILYGDEASPPVRTVLLTLKALQLDYEFQEVNVAAGEHLEPEYLAKNPLHTIPALEDEGKMILDSHAIAAYLVRKYSKDDDALYPRDYFERSICDQRLHYETGVLFYSCLCQITRPLFKQNMTEIPQANIDQIHEAYEVLEGVFLGGHDYMCGGKLTIADFSILSTVSALHLALASIEPSKYPNLYSWLKRMESLPFYEEANGKGVALLVEQIQSKLPKQFDKLWQKAVANTKKIKNTNNLSNK